MPQSTSPPSSFITPTKLGPIVCYGPEKLLGRFSVRVRPDFDLTSKMRKQARYLASTYAIIDNEPIWYPFEFDHNAFELRFISRTTEQHAKNTAVLFMHYWSRWINYNA